MGLELYVNVQRRYGHGRSLQMQTYHHIAGPKHSSRMDVRRLTNGTEVYWGETHIYPLRKDGS